MNWKSIVGETAPLLGSLLAGPAGANVGKILGETLLGNENASVTEIKNALNNPTQAQSVALKQMEINLQTKLSQIILDKTSLAINDRNSARQREMQVHDKIPSLLAILLTIGFFSVLFALLFFPMTNESSHIIGVMLGALGTAWISCITYYFGSSYGSQIKTQFLSEK
jgi:hypothetical protein